MGNASVLAEFVKLSIKKWKVWEDQMGQELGRVLFLSPSRTKQGSNFFFERLKPPNCREVR